MAYNTKSSFSKTSLLILVVVLVVMVQLKGSEAQGNCAAQLGSLNVCAAYVVPGAPNTNPSAECCTALQSVNHDCMCNTLRVASQLPSVCRLPALNCGN